MMDVAWLCTLLLLSASVTDDGILAVGIEFKRGSLGPLSDVDTSSLLRDDFHMILIEVRPRDFLSGY